MVFAAEDDDVVIAARVYPQIVVRIGGVGEERVWYATRRYLAGDDIGGVERELRLKQCRELLVMRRRPLHRWPDVFV